LNLALKQISRYLWDSPEDAKVMNYENQQESCFTPSQFKMKQQSKKRHNYT
jgi:hypothetical protein